ncbi:hypothetical protein VCRA2119O48_810005 [Vibrio crassostreae]|nr:hypothetical protein VCRA2119O48_810005 [Vibrio crassostreae]
MAPSGLFISLVTRDEKQDRFQPSDTWYSFMILPLDIFTLPNIES